MPLKTLIVGFGKIARDSHLPAIKASAEFDCVGAVDPKMESTGGLPVFPDLNSAATSLSPDVIVLATPPRHRAELIRQCAEFGCHLLVEKPPCLNMQEARQIFIEPVMGDDTLFTAWHSQYAAAVNFLESWSEGKDLVAGKIIWKENAQRWHPGQDWLWSEGGFGVFDPGINALSMMTRLFPRQWGIRDCRLGIPENAAMPAKAEFSLVSANASIPVVLEFHDSNDDIWTIELKFASGEDVVISSGGSDLMIDQMRVDLPRMDEYRAVYEMFFSLIENGFSEVHLDPLELVDEAMASTDRYSLPPIKI